jgi:adenylate cyclase
VNTTARLASAARAGEILISEDAVKASALDVEGLEVRQLSLKGKSEPLGVRVLSVVRP